MNRHVVGASRPRVELAELLFAQQLTAMVAQKAFQMNASAALSAAIAPASVALMRSTDGDSAKTRSRVDAVDIFAARVRTRCQPQEYWDE